MRAVQVGGNFNQPISVTAPAGDSRLFVVEKPGTIRIVENGSVVPGNFLDIRTVVASGGEGGLIGMAFSPVDGTLYWALGFRNPFRFSFDRANGDHWIGDVGQGASEDRTVPGVNLFFVNLLVRRRCVPRWHECPTS